MDADSSDTGAVVTDSLNGETKPDPAKLAQSAIIKQDVMLSGTSTQSPVSSVLAMPTISMPGASIPTVSMGNTSLHGNLPDSLFLSAVPSLNSDVLHSVADSKHDLAAASQTASVLSQQLLGQPQVAPQFIMTGQGLHGQSSAASAAASMPVQQLLIPVSTGNGTQQFVSIPVSMAGGSNQQIQLLTTSNGQIIATNLASLTQQLSMALGNNAAHSSTPSTTSSHSSSLATNNGHLSANHQPSPQAAASAALPQLITNSQGQIIALGSAAQAAHSNKTASHNSYTQQLLQQQQQLQQALCSSTASTTTTTSLQQQQQQHSAQQSSGHSALTTSLTSAQMALTQQALQAAVAANMPVTQVAQSIKQSLSSLSQSAGLQSVSLPQAHSLKMAPMAAAVTAQTIQAAVATQPTAAMVHQQQVVAAVTQSSTNHSLPPNVNQLLPNTVSNATESTTVDGINLDEIKEFAKQFKIRRLSLGLTQTQVGQALSATEGPAYSQSAICSAADGGRHYSQSAICRFEKLDITPKSAQKIKPVLEKWMKEAEERYKNGVQNLTDFIGSEPSKKRKRRTSFTPQAIEILNEFFERNTHPSGAEMTELAEKLNYDREVIRVWFCNKRQALKNTIKKLKS